MSRGVLRSVLALATTSTLATQLFLHSGCQFDTSTPYSSTGTTDADVDGDANRTDAGPDIDGDTPCVGDLLGFEIMNLEACDPPDPAPPLALTQSGVYSLDTDTGELSQPSSGPIELPFTVLPQAGGPDLFVVATTDFLLDEGSTLRVVGSRPLVVISTGDINIDGILAAVADGPRSGAGGNLDAFCADRRGTNGALEDNDDDGEAGTGGGGGGFATAGGNGGALENTDLTQPAGGESVGELDLVPLIGGCAGGDGGGSLPAPGGGAGGAIELVAKDTLRIDGLVTVRGGGGSGSVSFFGGGAGGGSGGGLILQATTLIVPDGRATANGGGGGEGTRASASGDNGDDGDANGNTPAPGGNGKSTGANGGSGGTITESPDGGGEGSRAFGTTAGAGGGGGAAGVVRMVEAVPGS